MTGRGHEDGAGGTRNTDRNGTTSALPRRSDGRSGRPSSCARFDRLMVNFQRMESVKLQRAHLRQHLLGMAIDLHIAPNLDDPATGSDQKGGPKNALEGLAIHRFFATDSVAV